MSAFVDALRAADKAASPAPFRFANDNIYDSRGDCVVRYGDEVGPYLGAGDDDLFVLLRNAAPEIAALVEAVDEASAVACQVGMVRYVEIDADEWARIRAALSRLEKTVKP